MKGLAPKNRAAIAFGSYGWGGESIKQVEEVLKDCKFDMLLEPVKVNYIPDTEELKQITQKVSEVI
jgi:flavorubredoxin